MPPKLLDMPRGMAYQGKSMMPAVMDVPGIALTPPEKVRDYSHLRKYQFKPGQRVQGCGRPKGTKNAATMLLKAAPRIAKAYVKKAIEGDTSVLVDSRKWILPIEQEVGDGSERSVIQVIFGASVSHPIDDSEMLAESSATSLTEHTLSDIPNVVNQQSDELIGNA